VNKGHVWYCPNEKCGTSNHGVKKVCQFCHYKLADKSFKTLEIEAPMKSMAGPVIEAARTEYPTPEEQADAAADSFTTSGGLPPSSDAAVEQDLSEEENKYLKRYKDLLEVLEKHGHNDVANDYKTRIKNLEEKAQSKNMLDKAKTYRVAASKEE